MERVSWKVGALDGTEKMNGFLNKILLVLHSETSDVSLRVQAIAA